MATQGLRSGTGFGSPARIQESLLAALEKRLLLWLAERIPSRLNSDHLTVLGFAAQLLTGISYALARFDKLWLIVGIGFMVLNWFGDSLDGNLARYRKIERPRYGYYLDHLTDAYSTLAVGVGLGLSPFMLLSVGLAISITYLVMSINVYLETHVFGQFNLGYGRFGPTEARVILIVLNSLAVMWTDLPFRVHGIGATLFDLVGLSAVAGMLTLLLIRIAKNLRTLAALEPPRRR